MLKKPAAKDLIFRAPISSLSYTPTVDPNLFIRPSLLLRDFREQPPKPSPLPLPTSEAAASAPEIAEHRRGLCPQIAKLPPQPETDRYLALYHNPKFRDAFIQLMQSFEDGDEDDNEGSAGDGENEDEETHNDE